MSVAAPSLQYSYAEYVAFERDARERHEFVGGLILAMAGGTLEHGALCSAVIIALGTQLAGQRCRVYDSNARVRVAASGNAYYADASVVCGHLETDPSDMLSMTNPILLVEVLSPSTEAYDRTDKLTDYQRIESLQHIVHVAHDAKRLDVWTRTPEGWRAESFIEGQTARLAAISCDLDVSRLYEDPLNR
jgi:Uma2 family endonuclease